MIRKIPIANPIITASDAKEVFKVVKSGWITMGKKVEETENKIKKMLKVKHAVLFNNGTSSLHAGLISLGIKKGDEVIVPTLSYISSANVIEYCDAKPIFCEVCPKTFNVTSEIIEKKITNKTKAIITVDLKGMPVDFDGIMKISKKYNIPVLSDSAESFGAIYKNQYVGGQANVHSFSFFANKNVTMGEGGLLTTNNLSIAKKAKIIRNQGQKKRYVHVLLGNNYRPTDFAAALCLSQIKRINNILKKKNNIAKKYSFAFSKNIDIEPPHVPSYVARHSWYMYCIKFKNKINRSKIEKFLNKKKIDTRLSFPPIHLQKFYKTKYNFKKGDFKVSENVFKNFLDIPIHPEMKEKEINFVIQNICEAIKLQKNAK